MGCSKVSNIMPSSWQAKSLPSYLAQNIPLLGGHSCRNQIYAINPFTLLLQPPNHYQERYQTLQHFKMAPSVVSPSSQSPLPSPPSLNKPLKSPLMIPQVKRTAGGMTQTPSFPAPLQYSGTLDAYESFDVASVTGREFPKLQLTEILGDDAKVRNLAVTGKVPLFTCD